MTTKSYLLEWLSGMLRLENVSAVFGSLKRRVFRLKFLEMRIDLACNNIDFPRETGMFKNVLNSMGISGYSDRNRSDCISMLNSVGSLGFWNGRRFEQDILATVGNPEHDVFLVSDSDSVIGMTVLHKPGPKSNLHEIGHVAVKRRFRNKRTSLHLLLYIVMEAKRRGITRIFLETDSFRLAAIKTYFNVGFVPYVKSNNERKRWKKVLKKLDIPVIYMEKNDGFP